MLRMVNDGLLTDPPWYFPLLLAMLIFVVCPPWIFVHATELADGVPLITQPIVTPFDPRIEE
jgi:hypothetical protein